MEDEEEGVKWLMQQWKAQGFDQIVPCNMNQIFSSHLKAFMQIQSAFASWTFTLPVILWLQAVPSVK